MSRAPTPAIPAARPTITPTGGSPPPMAFPVFTSYRANLFLGALHCGQVYVSGCKICVSYRSYMLLVGNCCEFHRSGVTLACSSKGFCNV